MQTPDSTGPVEVRFEFATNDPDNPVITFTLAANVKPVPEFVQRIDNPDLANGDRVNGLRLWPAAHPKILIERGEILTFSLRAWPVDPGSTPMTATTEHPGVLVPAGGASANTAEPAAEVPAGSVTTRVRSESAGSGYWVDVKAGPINKTGVFSTGLDLRGAPKELVDAGGGTLGVTLVVVDSSIAISPGAVNLGQVSIAALGTGPVQVGTLNVRKLFGKFNIVSVRSGLAALSFDVKTMVHDRNYVIRLRLNAGKDIRPGTMDSKIEVLTDDPKHLTLEVPLKLVLVP